MYDNIFQKWPAFFFMLSVMPDIAPFSKHLVATNFSLLEQKQSREKKTTQTTQQHQIKSKNQVQSQSRPGLSKLSAWGSWAKRLTI